MSLRYSTVQFVDVCRPPALPARGSVLAVFCIGASGCSSGRRPPCRPFSPPPPPPTTQSTGNKLPRNDDTDDRGPDSSCSRHSGPPYWDSHGVGPGTWRAARPSRTDGRKEGRIPGGIFSITRCCRTGRGRYSSAVLERIAAAPGACPVANGSPNAEATPRDLCERNSENVTEKPNVSSWRRRRPVLFSPHRFHLIGTRLPLRPCMHIQWSVYRIISQRTFLGCCRLRSIFSAVDRRRSHRAARRLLYNTDKCLPWEVKSCV